MSDFQICRLKGGHRLHRKLVGEVTAICGAEPMRRENSKGSAFNMKFRAGWWIYRDGFDAAPANPRFDFRCKICFKPPE